MANEHLPHSWLISFGKVGGLASVGRERWWAQSSFDQSQTDHYVWEGKVSGTVLLEREEGDNEASCLSKRWLLLAHLPSPIFEWP